MARQITGGTNQPAANAIDAHNETHRSVVALEFGGGAKPHYDGPEFDTSAVPGVEQVVSATLGAPAALADAITVILRAKVLFNLHLGYSNGGNGKKIYAHKVADAANPVTTPDTASGATETAAILAGLITLTTALRTAYEHHRQNEKPDGTAAAMAYHQNADNTNILGGLPTLATADQVADALNLLKATYEAHRVSIVTGGGGAHDNADGTNNITSPNCTAADLDSMITLANELETKFNAHLTQATVHHHNDGDNTVSTAAVAYPGDLFTLANALKAAINTHMGSTSYHETADAGVVTAANATTVASLIALAADVRTKLDAHLRNGPVSQAQRGV